MDTTGDLSARVLLKHILRTETPRTPVIRSNPQAPSTSELRRSSRLRRKDDESQTPQNILRRSLKQKVHESITRKSLPATKRRTPSVALRKLPSVSVLLSDEDTPRHLLRNILQTEPVKSPIVHKKGPPKKPEPQTANKTTTGTRSSIELSGLDLPDITIGNAASTVKGLSRKRPHRSLNVTAFEKKLKDKNDAEVETNISTEAHSSLSLSSTSLSLKTPFVDVRTEKRGLQRKVSNRRKVTVAEFEAALNQRRVGDLSRHGFVEGNLGEVTNCEGFTLGLSKLSQHDTTADIVNYNTALYAQPDSMTSNFSILATQDKPTIMASQLQRDSEMERGEDHSRMKKDNKVDVFLRGEAATSPQNDESISDSRMQEDVNESREGSRNNMTDAGVMLKSEEEEDEAESEAGEVDDHAESEEVEAQTEEEDEAESEAGEVDDHAESEEVEAQTEEEDEAESETGEVDDHAESEEVEAQTEEEDEAESETGEVDDHAESEEVEAQTEEEDVSDSRFEKNDELKDLTEKNEVSPDSQTEKEEGVAEMEECASKAQSEDVESSHSEEEEDAEGSQTEEIVARASSQDVIEAGTRSEFEEDVAEFQTGDGSNEQKEEEALEHLEDDLDHISRRARRSDGALILPVTEDREDLTNTSAAGWSDSESKAHGSHGLNASGGTGKRDGGRPRTGSPAWTKPSVHNEDDVCGAENYSETENNDLFHPLGVTQDIQVSRQRSDSSPDEAPAQEDSDQEENWEDDEEVEEFPCKTPAFVKEKRNFYPDPSASPSVLKKQESEALPAAKPKQVRRRKRKTSSKLGLFPKTYLMSTFRHFAKMKVSADVYPVLSEIMDKFFTRVVEDLETYAAHAKRKTIEVEDAVLLLKRQGHVNDKVPVEALIEKYLRMEQRKILIPIATSNNVVVPKKMW